MAWNDGKHPSNFIDPTGERFTKLVKARRDAEEKYHGEFYNKELRNE